MKKKGAKCDWLDARNESLRRELNRRLDGSDRGIGHVYRNLAHAPAPRFFISEEQAFREVKRLIRARCQGAAALSGLLRGKMPNRARMLRDILKGVDALLSSSPSLPLREAVYQVVNSPAPSFYLTPASMHIILCRHRRCLKSKAI